MPCFSSILTRAAALLLLALACRASADTYTLTLRGHVGPATQIVDPDKHLDATLVSGTPVQVTVTLPYPAQSMGASLDDLTYPFPPQDAGAPATWGVTAAFGDYVLHPGPHPAGSSLEVANAPAHSPTGAFDRFLVTQNVGALTGPAAAFSTMTAFTLEMDDNTGEVFSTAALPLHLDPSAFSVRWMQFYFGYDGTGTQSARFMATIDTAVVSIHQDGTPRPPENRPSDTFRLTRVPLVHVGPDFLLGEMRRALVPAGGGLLPPGVSSVVPNAQDGSLLADATPAGLAALRAVIRLLDVPSRPITTPTKTGRKRTHHAL